MQGKVRGDAFEVVQLSGDLRLTCGSTSAVKVPGCPVNDVIQVKNTCGACGISGDRLTKGNFILFNY